jgi:DNA-binding transcriptional LysR family regulator
MRDSGLTELEAVAAVARVRQFRAAARELGVSRSSLSAAVQSLEARLKTRLFHRTTRSVSLTEAGERFLAEIVPALARIRDAMSAVDGGGAEPAGTLRINASLGAAERVTRRFVVPFLRQNPAVHVDIVTEGRLIDIVRAGFDAGVRVAEDVPRDMVSLRLGLDHRFIVVAAPALVARPPRAPADLASFPCIAVGGASGEVYRWEFARRGRWKPIDVEGPLTLDAPAVIRTAARSGVGLAYLPAWYVAADLRAGRLVQVLADWTPSIGELCLYYPQHRYLPPALAAFVASVRRSRAHRSGLDGRGERGPRRSASTS